MVSEKQNLGAIAGNLSRPFVHAVVGRVDDYCVYLTRMFGDYRYHSHGRDELYLVLEGEIIIDYSDGRRVTLTPHESLVVKAGESHRSAAERDALVLMFKACEMFAE